MNEANDRQGNKLWKWKEVFVSKFFNLIFRKTKVVVSGGIMSHVVCICHFFHVGSVA